MIPCTLRKMMMIIVMIRIMTMKIMMMTMQAKERKIYKSWPTFDFSNKNFDRKSRHSKLYYIARMNIYFTWLVNCVEQQHPNVIWSIQSQTWNKRRKKLNRQVKHKWKKSSRGIFKCWRREQIWNENIWMNWQRSRSKWWLFIASTKINSTKKILPTLGWQKNCKDWNNKNKPKYSWVRAFEKLVMLRKPNRLIKS